MIFADECVHRLILELLSQSGYTFQRPPPGTRDEIVLQLSVQAGVVLLTGDKDFGDLTVRDGHPAIGVVLYRLPGVRPTDQAIRILEVLTTHKDLLHGNLVVIDRNRVRIRPLNGR